MATIADLASRVTLVGLTFTAWRPLRKHKPATAKLNEANHTSSGKASVILTDAASLKAVFAAQAAAHELNRSLTLGSAQDGLRMLPAGSQLKHAQAMQHSMAAVQIAVNGFLAEYEHERDTAPIRLGGLYLARHWPSLASVAAHFSANVRYLPCPVDGAWGTWLEESANLADAELRERCTDVLTRVVERCRSDGRLYASVLSDVQELAASLPAMNLSDAPDLDAVARAAQQLGALDVEQLRASDVARAAAADRAASILDMLKPAPTLALRVA